MLRRTSRRTRIVWAAFAASMTLATGLLVLGDEQGPRGIVAAGQGTMSESGKATFGFLGSLFGGTREVFENGSPGDPITPREAPLDAGRWQAIVIHHSGMPAGDPESIERQHLALGYAGLGYHFVLGNGHGFGDGAVFVGPRWNRQQPGAHASGQQAEWLNQHAIGICLVGNGDRRPFTERQMRELVALVRRLQDRLRIPASSVLLHTDVAPVSSPGRLFPSASFESRLGS